MKIVLATVQVPLIRGGAEVLADSLRYQLQRAGHEVEIVAIPWEADSTDSILAGIEAAQTLDLERLAGTTIDRVIALKFPAYLVPHPRKTLWLIHQHHGAYERWDSPLGLINSPDGRLGRAAIQAADRRAFQAMARRFTISRTVQSRLARCGFEAEVLYPPPQAAERFFQGDDQGYFFFPSRLTPSKRHELVLEALALTRLPVRLVCCGAADSADLAHQLAERSEALGLTQRVSWLGAVDPVELRELYAHCRAVVFPPADEDYGYITLEAMLSGKPVITCTDSGGPLEFVEDGRNGKVTEPTPASLAAALDELQATPSWAIQLGETAREDLRRAAVAWPATLQALLGELP